ncbi:MAG: protein kinase [Alistipes sp.]|nr:protein kinase [Alistipes sp.]
MQLQPGTLLKAGSYRIIRTLGRGGFGITYLAEQVMVRRQVCVKEFFPKDYYKRDGDTRNITLSSDGFGQMMDKFKTKFLKEAQIIAGLDHPNIIRIHDVFEENGTAYYVMEYIEGESLQSIVSRRGALGRDEAVGYIEQLAAALGYIHSHDIAHLDVKPGNVMVRSKDDRALLIDFGLSKHYDSEGMQTSSTPLGISHGFAPIEQYQVGGVSTFSPRTDIYSMGATLYYLAMGKVPPAAANVGEDGLDELPSHFGAGVCTAIERSMQYRRKDRPASAEEFMSLVRGGGQTTFVDGPKRDEGQRREPQRDVRPQPQREPRPEPRSSKPEGDKPKMSKWWLWLLLAVVGVICGIALMGGDGEEIPSTADMYYAAPAEETTKPADYVAVDSPEPVKLPDPILTLKSKSSVTLDADGGSGKITYTLTNPRDDMQLSAKSNANWISVSRSGSTISYSTTANNGESSRSGKITVKYGDQSFEVLISQAGKLKPVAPEVNTYKIGDYYNENGKQGVVFEVWDGGRHGKIVSLDETRATWDSRVTKNGTRTYANSESDGKANTDKIMARSDSKYFEAFAWCRAKGNSWYLPALNELKSIYNNKSKLNTTLQKYGTTLNQWYWTSTECVDEGEFCAWYVSKYGGDALYNLKNGSNYVRAVSAF